MASSTRKALQADGLLMAPIQQDGVWGAVQALRRGMRRLAGDTETAFITAISREGTIVSGQDPEATVLILGYRSG